MAQSAELHIHPRTDRSTRPTPGLRSRLTAACHILAREGHGNGLAGQVTTLDEDGRLWTLPLGLGLEEVGADDLICVSTDPAAFGQDTRPNPAVRFHLWMYRARPDLRAIVHTHPPALSAYAMLGRPLYAAHMDDCMFHDDIAHLPDWPGVPVGDDEGHLISAALGSRSCALLAGHGYVATGHTLEEAVYRAVSLERMAARHLLARSAHLAEPAPLADAQASEAREFLLQPRIVNSTFNYWARLAARTHLQSTRRSGQADTNNSTEEIPS
jgi:L-fuculose-phosphate aldolase